MSLHGRAWRFFASGACLLLLAAFSAQELTAQQPGRVTGTVTTTAGDALNGAIVTAVEARRGVLTDVTGGYEIEVAPGSYTIRAEFIGYGTMEQQVTVAAGQTVTVNFALTVDPLSLTGLTVTATREARPAQEVAQSIQVLSSEQLERLEPTSSADALRTVPGIHAEGGGGEVAVNSFVRGFPSGGQFLYQTLEEDGMPVRSLPGGFISAEDVLFRQDLNVEALEVAKGGAATIYGISAPGGIINYRSKTGGDVVRSTVKGTVGTKDLYRIDFNSNGPLGEDFRYNIGGFYRFDEGPRVSGLPTRGLQLKGNITRRLPSGFIRLYAKYIDDQVQFLLPFAHRRVGNDIEPAIAGDGTQNSGQAADFVVNTPDGRFESTMANGVKTKGAMVMLETQTDLGAGWSIMNKFRWADYDHEFNIFIPLVPRFADDFAAGFKPDPSYIEQFTFTDNKQPFCTGPTGCASSPVTEQGVWGRFRPVEDLANDITLQFRTVTGEAQHLFSLGAYLSRTDVRDDQIRPFALFELADRPRTLDLILVNPAGDDTVFVTAPGGISQASNNFFKRGFGSNLVSIYGGDEIQVGRWRIDLGARYERQTATIQVENTSRFDVGPTVAEQQQVFPNGEVSSREVQFDDIGVVGAIGYQVNDNLNVYGTGGRGFRFPTLDNFLNVAIDSQGNFVQPDIDSNEEALYAEGGVKLATEQVSGTLAGYWTEIKDLFRREIKIIDGQAVNVVQPFGKTRTIGAEITGAFAPSQVPGGRIEAAVTLQDHECVDCIFGADTLNGNELKRQPNIIVNASAVYQRYGFDLWLNWHHLGDRFADDANNQELDAFNVFSLDVGYTIPLPGGSSLRLGVNGYNLFDNEGLTEGDPRLPTGVDPSDFPFFNARPVLPQRFKVTARYTF